MEHLIDFAWMQKGFDAPEQVPATAEAISLKMVAGYRQVFDEVGDKPETAKTVAEPIAFKMAPKAFSIDDFKETK